MLKKRKSLSTRGKRGAGASSVLQSELDGVPYKVHTCPISPFPFVFWRQPTSGNEPAREWLQRLGKEDRRKMGLAMLTVRLASRNAAVSAYGRWLARIAGVVEGKAGSPIIVLRP